MDHETAFLLTIVVLCYAVISGLVKRWYLAPALIFVLIGMALGRDGLHWIKVGVHAQSFTVLAQVALTVILFNQASTLDIRTVLRKGHLTVRLLLIGIPLTIALGTLTAVVLLPVLPLWEAVCLAAVVAPTEVVLIDALLEDSRIPERIRHAMSAESGFYDGFALAALLAALALASEQTDHAAVRWAWFAFRTEVVSVAVGAVIGLVGATVINRSSARGWMSDTWAQLAIMALALVCFGVGERLHGSGFVTAFAAGMAYAMVPTGNDDRSSRIQLSDAAAQLLELLVFALFGAFAVIPAWRGMSWRVVLFAIVALVGVRIAAISIALINSGLSRRSTLFIGWFGPRGIGTLVLGLLVIDQGTIHQQGLITQAVVVTVTVSLVLHSLTTPAGIRLCHEHQPSTGSPTPAGHDEDDGAARAP
jgi:NhaP-type Na+/H+ or K+/H+ antiporter